MNILQVELIEPKGILHDTTTAPSDTMMNEDMWERQSIEVGGFVCLFCFQLIFGDYFGGEFCRHEGRLLEGLLGEWD